MSYTLAIHILLHLYHIAAAHIAAKKQHEVKAFHLALQSRQRLRSFLLEGHTKYLLVDYLFFYIAAILQHFWL